MGMSFGGSQGRPVSDPNVVPLIDVLLVLIIIFMVIAPQLSTGLPTLLPEAPPPQSKTEPRNPHTIMVRVMQGGKLMINLEQSDWNRLGTRLSDIFKERADKVAFVIMRGAGIDHVDHWSNVRRIAGLAGRGYRSPSRNNRQVLVDESRGNLGLSKACC